VPGRRARSKARSEHRLYAVHTSSGAENICDDVRPNANRCLTRPTVRRSDTSRLGAPPLYCCTQSGLFIVQWVRFQISQNHANTGEKYEIFTPNRDTIQVFLQYGCSNMHFILAVYLNLQIYDIMMQAILVQT